MIGPTGKAKPRGRRTIVFVVSFALVAGSVLLPVHWWKSEHGAPPEIHELTRLSGHVRSLVKTRTNGTGNKPIIHLAIQEDLRDFVIEGPGYRAVKGLELLEPGVEIEFWVRTTEERRSNSTKGIDLILNSVFEWRKSPEVHALRTKTETLLGLDDFRREAEDSNHKLAYLGMLLAAAMPGRVLFVLWKERRNKRA